MGSEFGKTISKLVDLTSGVQWKWFFKLVQYDNVVKTFPLVVDFSDCVEIMFGKYDNCFKGLYGEYSMSDAGLSWSGDADVDTDIDCHLIDDCDGGKILLSFDIKERNEFPSKSVLKKYMNLIAIRGNFEFKADRSDADFYVLSCIVDGCTCNEHRQASCQFVGELLKEDFSLGINEKARLSDVMALMRWKHGVEISYHVARKARSFALEAIRGSAEQPYLDIPSLCAVLEDKNQGKCLVDFM
ncbi:hypothetical protein TIFTF001_035289 [Ficus carica]|uniref:Uncharacterized protein n=1 Tax=Ficus carica TaxID=3494 RepID=A0AA88E1E3_FICCA|nr:hypothetical protein TIFTF001_035289 [Ficus carica]